MDITTLNQTIVQCRKCPRLVEYREKVAATKKRAYLDCVYWGKPVPALGDIDGRVMVVGLAPGPHGSNRTGRMFTGDASGKFLFKALFKAGFVNQEQSVSRGDGLEVEDMLITAVCRCVPPDNKPTREEIRNCLPYLEEEIKLMKNLQGFVALGRIGFENILSLLRTESMGKLRFDFKHGAIYRPGADLGWIIASYHPSQQNTLTGRLTSEMFDRIWSGVKEQLF